MTLVLGIDCGLSKPNPCGLALIETDPLTLVYADAYVPPGETYIDRIIAVAARVQWLAVNSADRADVGLIAVELPWLGLNVQTTIRLAYTAGAVMGVAALYGIPVVGVQPAEGKQALTGRSDASKTDMIAAVRQVFGVELKKDATDAVAVSMAGEALWRRAALVGEQT